MRSLPSGLPSRLLAVALGTSPLLAAPAQAQDALPDLAARLDRVYYDDGTVVIEGAIRNGGTGSYPGGDAVKIRTSDGVSRYLTMPALPPGTEYRFNLAVPGAGPQVQLSVQADPRGVVAEPDKANNKVELTVGRLVDLAVVGLVVEQGPAPGATARLTAEIVDTQVAPGTEAPPATVEVSTQASLRPPDGAALGLVADRLYITGFTGHHYLPVDVRVPADAGDRVQSAVADLVVEVCVDPDDKLRESAEVCDGGSGCNNCSTRVFPGVALGLSQPAPAEAPAAPAPTPAAPAPTPAAPAPTPAAPAPTAAAEPAPTAAAEPAPAQAEAPAAPPAGATRVTPPPAPAPVAPPPAPAPVAPPPAPAPSAPEPVAAVDPLPRTEVPAQAVAAPAPPAAPTRVTPPPAPAPVAPPPEPVAAVDPLPRTELPEQAVAAPPVAALAPAGPRPADPANAPDIVITGLSFEPGVIGVSNRATVEVKLLRGSLEGVSDTVAVELRHEGWRFSDATTGQLDLSALAETGTATVALELLPRATPGRCGPTYSDYTNEPFDLVLGSPMAEDLAGYDDNNRRRYTPRLACLGPGEGLGLGPYPDPLVAAIEPYLAREEGVDYLRFQVTLHNLGTPLHAERLELEVDVGDRSWLPATWAEGATATYALAAVVDEPINALPPRRAHLCGVGGDAFPMRDLPDFARSQRGTRPVGTDNSVEVTVAFTAAPALRQQSLDNDALTVLVPLDRDLRRAEDTPCGGRPQRFGVEATRARSVLPALPAVARGAVAASLRSAPLEDGRVELTGELRATGEGGVKAVPYAWYRDGVWAGGGVVDLPAEGAVPLLQRDVASSRATWTLVADPDGQLPGDERKDNTARLQLR